MYIFTEFKYSPKVDIIRQYEVYLDKFLFVLNKDFY